MDTVASPHVRVGGARDIFDLAKRQGQVRTAYANTQIHISLCLCTTNCKLKRDRQGKRLGQNRYLNACHVHSACIPFCLYHRIMLPSVYDSVLPRVSRTATYCAHPTTPVSRRHHLPFVSPLPALVFLLISANFSSCSAIGPARLTIPNFNALFAAAVEGRADYTATKIGGRNGKRILWVACQDQHATFASGTLLL